MTPEQALEIVSYRRKYCANLYGPDFKVELPIYEACERALRFQIENKGREPVTPEEARRISKVFQNYYCTGVMDIAKEDETIASLFKKIGLIEIDDDRDNLHE